MSFKDYFLKETAYPPVTLQQLMGNFQDNEDSVITKFVYEEHQRKGLALTMYRMIIEDAGMIISGNSLTGEDRKGGSFDVWKKLGTLYPYKYVFQHYQTSGKLISVNSFERNLMKQSDQRFIVSKKPLNIESK